MTDDTLAFWLALDALKGISTHRKASLVETFSIAELKQRALDDNLPSLSSAQRHALAQPDPKRLASAQQWLSKSTHNQLLTLDHPDYPAQLKAIADPPLLLFVSGDLSRLAMPTIAIVGSRNASSSGRALATKWAKQFAELGLLVMSGLAEGIDAAAHVGALEGGATAAVQGCGMNYCYPKRHYTLRQRIVENGVLVSAFAPEVPVRRHHFPMRNRIVSGLSLGVLVVEAAERSGSLITARLAAEQGRDVFAVPGNIQSPSHSGCNKLIQTGAKLVISPVDIIYEMLPQLKNEAKNGGDQRAEDLRQPNLLVSVDYEATPVDEIVKRSRLPVSQVLEQLTEMELEGWVESVPGGYIRLIKA